MNKEAVIKFMEGLMDETEVLVCVDKVYMPIKGIGYMPSHGDEPAKLVIHGEMNAQG